MQTINRWSLPQLPAYLPLPQKHQLPLLYRVLLEEPHPASIAAIMQTERPAAVNLRLFFINLILLLLHHCLVHFKRIVIVFFFYVKIFLSGRSLPV